MLHSLSTVDMAVVILLLLFIVAASMWSSFKKKYAEAYFMASRPLRW